MSSALSGIPAAKRRRLAAAVGLFAALFAAVGIVGNTGNPPGAVRVFAVIALVVAGLLALIAWGLVTSVHVDAAEADVDARIEQVVRSSGAPLCDCGHAHDPDELHVTDDPCDSDGHGVECTHTCETCVLQTLRR